VIIKMALSGESIPYDIIQTSAHKQNEVENTPV